MEAAQGQGARLPVDRRALAASTRHPAEPQGGSAQRLLDDFRRQDEIVREFMRPNAAGLQAWFNRAA